jgi:pyruvate kinase
VAKIEKPEAVALLDQILEETDAVMIARGDLGVEIRAERVPLIQRDIIRRASQMQKPVITATQMLDSMTQKMRPTRAEVTDVSHAVLEGSDAVMLSGETAVGIGPVNAVRTMSAIVRQAETEAVRSTPASADAPQQALQTGCGSVKNIHQALQCGALSADVAAIVVIGNEWGRVQDLPKVARSTPVILATDSPVLARQSALWHGVLPILIERCGAYTEVGCEVLRLARRHGYLNPGQLVAVIEYVNSPATELVEEGALHITRIDGS